ncbi:DUF4832 domain-containing protein [Oharaeibacter diazotrophicus]|uniref:Uncharacterized protein DUF4874 n=1 Tax=Oharaeibacter diazotrophicus TaxID=1920512 RepID=A0A4R6RKN7_9HYPH|nr:DUF4832 domain-containing protein [Oharaeibacter diazotrophicus]TDP86507.1 uncharacterized protein DUF4874 [Oharaeibacter diazotrophicus]BBE71551.1 hypothetical protein OHA_1_01127 [Pleomorphomonas sp. SM30]GLS78311.1 hypothetical protein GCM10007904_36480 [Oharaeibacter diazotrophicus]
MTIRRAAALLAAVVAVAAPAAAPAATVGFAAYPGDLANPERGWWAFLSDDFASLTAEGADAFASRGLTLGYALIRLDDYRDADIPNAVLTDIDRAFNLVQSRGLKVVLRVVYNNPGEDEPDVRDAPLARVLRHIAQLKPVIAIHSDVIAVWQAGFIGLWGEGHGSTNGLDDPAAKRRIRDALLAALPKGRLLQWRRPEDLIAWAGEKGGAAKIARIGVHNDCFLASDIDVGTYSDDPVVRARQRRFVAKQSATTIFGGETCEPDKDATPRMTCNDILREGATFHVVTLGRDYYPPFHDAWRAGGCFDKVERSLGYRLVLTTASAPAKLKRGAAFAVSIGLRNDGWSRVPNPRRLVVTLVHRQTGFTHTVVDGDAQSVLPKSPARIFNGRTKLPADAPAGAYDVVVAAPDPAVLLAGDPRYAVRFANADRPARGQRWDAVEGHFVTGLAVTLAP